LIPHFRVNLRRLERQFRNIAPGEPSFFVPISPTILTAAKNGPQGAVNQKNFLCLAFGSFLELKPARDAAPSE
jgi:hypothetical protein